MKTPSITETYDHILVGASTTWMKPHFISQALELFVREKAGNVIHLWPSMFINHDPGAAMMYGWNHTGEGDPWDEWVKFCIDHDLFVQFCYTSLPEAQMQEYVRRIGQNFLGYNVGECEGLIGWVYSNREKVLPPHADNLVDAQKYYIDHVARDISQWVKGLKGKIPIWNYVAGWVRTEEVAGGLTSGMIELFAGDNYDSMISFERGMHRSLATPSWGAFLAASYWAGIRQEDRLKQLRYRLGLYHAYLAGAPQIVIEGGVFHNDRGSTNVVRSFGPEMDERFNDNTCKSVRKTLAEFYAFTQLQPRLAGGPRVKVAFVRGYLDGYVKNNSLPAPLTSWFVYGQYGNEPFRCGDPERLWHYLDELHRNVEWDNRYEYGPQSLSGTVAFGQYDIVDIGASLEALRRYDVLIFAGWNTMTEENYQKLTQYVREGGHLVLALPHLATNIRRGEPWTFIRGGDIADLCGVRIRGKGELLRNLAYFDPEGCPYDLSFREYGRYAGFGIDQRFSGDLELCGARAIAYSMAPKNIRRIDDDSTPRFPFVLFHPKGRGHVVVMNSWDYPGCEGLYPIYTQLIRKVCQHYGREVRVLARDKVRWSVYTADPSGTPGEDFTQVFLLNTDFDLPQHCGIHTSGMAFDWVLQPCEFRTFFAWRNVFYTLNAPARMAVEGNGVRFYGQKGLKAVLWDSQTRKERDILL